MTRRLGPKCVGFLVLAALLCARPVFATPNYAGDAALLSLSSVTTYTSPTETLGASGTDAAVIAVLTSYASQAFTTFQYGGRTMALLGSAEIGTSGAYVYVYDQTGPAASGTFVFKPVVSTVVGLLWFSYSGVSAVGTSTGTVIKAANSYSGGSGSNQSIAFNVTPTSSTGTIVELLSQVCSCGTSMDAYTTTPGTLTHGLSDVASMVSDGFYDDMPASVSPITVSQVFNPQYNTMDVLGFSIELLGGVGTPTSTATPSPTPMPSATATPVMALTKTSNVSVASIGNTVTYCIAYQNGSTGTVTMNLWDTISAYLTYVGSSPAGTVSGSLIKWSVAGVTAGGSGSVCFWATVNGFPFAPGWMTSGVKLAGWNATDFLYGLGGGGIPMQESSSEAGASRTVEPKPDRL
jgi:uncharacterized repeat protein (TIGR01451 family)